MFSKLFENVPWFLFLAVSFLLLLYVIAFEQEKAKVEKLTQQITKQNMAIYERR